MAARRYKISLQVLKNISRVSAANKTVKYFFNTRCTIYYVAIAMVIFSHVKISCFHAKAQLVFHWCLYNKLFSFIFRQYGV